jgi:hypothetical protein
MFTGLGMIIAGSSEIPEARRSDKSSPSHDVSIGPFFQLSKYHSSYRHCTCRHYVSEGLDSHDFGQTQRQYQWLWSPFWA